MQTLAEPELCITNAHYWANGRKPEEVKTAPSGILCMFLKYDRDLSGPLPAEVVQ